MEKQPQVKMTLAQYKAVHEYFSQLAPAFMLPLEESLKRVQESDEITITDLEHEKDQPA